MNDWNLSEEARAKLIANATAMSQQIANTCDACVDFLDAVETFLTLRDDLKEDLLNGGLTEDTFSAIGREGDLVFDQLGILIVEAQKLSVFDSKPAKH
jgi:hypothetical protein